jgi:diguanylate cyclase (GGDEF)-like protein
MKKFPLPLRTLSPFLAALVVLALVAMICVGSIDRFDRNMQEQARQARIIGQLHEARVALVGPAMPGAVGTVPLEQERHRLAEADRHLDALEQLHAANPAALERLAVIRTLQDQRLQALGAEGVAAPVADTGQFAQQQGAVLAEFDALLEEAAAAEYRAQEKTAGARQDAWQFLWALLGLMATMLASAIWVLAREINARHHLAERLKYEVTHDSQTGLPNRRFFNQWLERALAQARRERRQIALLYLDLDGFKHVNDRLGHEVGDRLLRVVAKRFRETIRESDMLVSLGGDEFAILSPATVEPDNAGVFAERLQAALAAPLLPQYGEEYPVAVSIGVAFYPRDAASPTDIVLAAEQAMHVAKRDGGGCCRFARDRADSPVSLPGD